MDNNLLKVALLTLLFCVVTSISIVLTGNRELISGDIFHRFFKIIFDWRFILAFLLAVVARFTFILINNALLSIPSLAKSSTTITVFITSISYVTTVLLNIIFLHERLSLAQWGGAFFVIFGVVLLTL